MSTTLNQIDELRKRASVGYSEAKEALEKTNGDMLEALIYLEQNNKSNCRRQTSFGEKVSALIRKGSNIRCIMQKQDRVIFSLSLNVVVLIALFTLPFIELIALGMLIALFTGHRFKLQGCNGQTEKINQTLDRVSNAADQIKERLSNCTAENTNTTNE